MITLSQILETCLVSLCTVEAQHNTSYVPGPQSQLNSVSSINNIQHKRQMKKKVMRGSSAAASDVRVANQTKL